MSCLKNPDFGPELLPLAFFKNKLPFGRVLSFNRQTRYDCYHRQGNRTYKTLIGFQFVKAYLR